MRWALLMPQISLFAKVTENTLDIYEAESLKATCQHLRDHVHVHSKLFQEFGEGGGLLENSNLCHLLHSVCWQRNAASPTQSRGTKDQVKDSAEIETSTFSTLADLLCFLKINFEQSAY